MTFWYITNTLYQRKILTLERLPVLHYIIYQYIVLIRETYCYITINERKINRFNLERTAPFPTVYHSCFKHCEMGSIKAVQQNHCKMHKSISKTFTQLSSKHMHKPFWRGKLSILETSPQLYHLKVENSMLYDLFNVYDPQITGRGHVWGLILVLLE